MDGIGNKPPYWTPHRQNLEQRVALLEEAVRRLRDEATQGTAPGGGGGGGASQGWDMAFFLFEP